MADAFLSVYVARRLYHAHGIIFGQGAMAVAFSVNISVKHEHVDIQPVRSYTPGIVRILQNALGRENCLKIGSELRLYLY